MLDVNFFDDLRIGLATAEELGLNLGVEDEGTEDFDTVDALEELLESDVSALDGLAGELEASAADALTDEEE